MTNDIIISQLREMFKGMIEEVLREERREYLKETYPKNCVINHLNGQEHNPKLQI